MISVGTVYPDATPELQRVSGIGEELDAAAEAREDVIAVGPV